MTFRITTVLQLYMLTFLLLLGSSCGELQRLILLGPETAPPTAEFFVRENQISPGMTAVKLEWDLYTKADFLAYRIYISTDIAGLNTEDYVFQTYNRNTNETYLLELTPGTRYYALVTVARRLNGELTSNRISFETPSLSLENVTPISLHKKDNSLFVMSEEKSTYGPGILSIDITNPDSPSISAYQTLNFSSLETKRLENTLISSSYLSLKLLSLSDPLNVTTNSLSISELLFDLEITSANIYGVSSSQGLFIYEHDNFSSISKIATYPTAGDFSKIKRYDNKLYIMNREFGIQIFDITTPASPTLNSSIDVQERVTEFLLSGTTLLVGTQYSGLKCYDVSNPALPVYLSKLELSASGGIAMAVKDSTLYYAITKTGIMVIDISDPSAPVLTKTIVGKPADMLLEGNRLYILDNLKGIVIESI